jgi:hypothetical protein
MIFLQGHFVEEANDGLFSPLQKTTAPIPDAPAIIEGRKPRPFQM